MWVNRKSFLFWLIGGISALLIQMGVLAASSDAKLVQNTVESYLQAQQTAGNKPNRLIHESSPYLLQHAYNPVQWHPWGDEAFELARQQNKPIFLSIGYSTCYWCHVMAHESFENDAIAAILNDHFIAIKLDREERPDIDDVYMAATQLINGYGGWPMTVFLTHDLEPFHAGVYYPPETTDDHIGLTELLLKVADLWRQNRSRIDRAAAQVTSQIKAAADDSTAGGTIDPDAQRRAFEQIDAMYDSEYGGFGGAPKFPRAEKLVFLLEVAASDDKYAQRALAIARETLVAMSQGGLYDQVGGGFHRYAVDAQWQVPHFEKMLYTQALVSLAYTRLYQIDPDPVYRDVVAATLDFVLREMRDPNGGFFSALDASSERPDQPGSTAEGAYYLWSAKQLQSVLDKAEWVLVRDYYDIDENGNIRSDPHGAFKGLNILHVSEKSRESGLDEKQAELINGAREKLYQARLKRPRPHLDDKIITAWNGMMIAALAAAAVVFEDARYLEAAQQAAAFIRDHLVDQRSGRLYRRLRDGEAGIEATLADYAWTVNGMLALYQNTGERSWLKLAQQLTEQQLQSFYDDESGGFFESGPDRNVLFRTKSAYDGALPAPNAIAVENLLSLSELTGDKRWQQKANETLSAFARSINNDPARASWMLTQINPAANKEKSQNENQP
jgi:uncharacterized protein YyaL (SSP411 family)